MESRRAYDSEFKKGAVRLVTEGGKRISEVARDLGVSANQLHRWIKQMKADQDGAFPGKGHLRPADEHLRRLERELRDVREERDILKKAISIFSKVKP